MCVIDTYFKVDGKIVETVGDIDGVVLGIVCEDHLEALIQAARVIYFSAHAFDALMEMAIKEHLIVDLVAIVQLIEQR